MKVWQIGKRNQAQCFHRLYRSTTLRLRGGFGMGRFNPSHRFYKDLGPLSPSYTRVTGWARYDG